MNFSGYQILHSETGKGIPEKNKEIKNVIIKARTNKVPLWFTVG